MKVYIASDHGGFEYKEELKKYLADKGYEVEDIGPHDLNPEDDYPDFVIPCAQKVALRHAQGENDLGIILGRSGNGEAIAANKVEGIRAALCLNSDMARLAREHNDANILSMGAELVDLDAAKKIAVTFLETDFSKEKRHIRRLDKIKNYESSNS